MPKTVAIFMAGQQGDIVSALSVMRYRNEIFGDAKIVWYAAKENFDLFKYQDIEVIEFPRGFGYPEMVYEENKKLVDAGKEPIWEDWKPLVDEKNHMNLELKNNYPSLADIDYGYFPAPHQVLDIRKIHGVDYPNVSRKIFGIPDHYEWHPVINFSLEETNNVFDFMENMGGGKSICLETFAGSGQSLLDESMIAKAMSLCNERYGECNFIFASHKFLRSNEIFPSYLFEQPNVYSCKDFTVRQCALIAEQCDLMISVSSGITVASSAWGITQPKTIQFCGSFICSTKSLSNTPHFELVTYDDKPFENAKEEFYNKLTELLNENK